MSRVTGKQSWGRTLVTSLNNIASAILVARLMIRNRLLTANHKDLCTGMILRSPVLAD